MQPSLKRAINISGLTVRQKVFVRIFQRMRPHALIRLMSISQVLYDLVDRYINSASLVYLASENYQADDFKAWLGLLRVVATFPRETLALPLSFSSTLLLLSMHDVFIYLPLLLDTVSELLLRSKTFLHELHCNLDLVCDYLLPVLQELNLHTLIFYKPYQELTRDYYNNLSTILTRVQSTSDYTVYKHLKQNCAGYIRVLDDVVAEVFHMYRNLTSLTIPARVVDFIMPDSLEMQVLDEDLATNLTHLSTILIVRAGDLEHERVLSLQCQFYNHLFSLSLDITPFWGVNNLFIEHRGLQRLTLYSSSGLVECPILVLPALRRITLELTVCKESSTAGGEMSLGVFLTTEALISLLANSLSIVYINAVYSSYITKQDITEKLYGLSYPSLIFFRLRFFLLGSEELERRGITSAAAARLAHKMPRVRKLTLSGFRDMLCDGHMACILKCCPNLEELSLTGRHDVLPNTKQHVCSCESQLLCHTPELRNSSEDSDQTGVYPAASHRYHAKEAQYIVEHPPQWAEPEEGVRDLSRIYYTSKLAVLKLKQVYITDRTFINLYLLGAGSTLKVLWLDDLSRVSAIGVNLIINQVLLYGPLLTSGTRMFPTQPSDFSDQICTVLTKRMLAEHNERNIWGHSSDSKVIDDKSTSSQTGDSSTTSIQHESRDQMEHIHDNSDTDKSTETTESSHLNSSNTMQNLSHLISGLKKLDKHIVKCARIMNTRRAEPSMLKICNRSFSDSYLPSYHLPRYNFNFAEDELQNASSQQLYDEYFEYQLGFEHPLDGMSVMSMSQLLPLEPTDTKPKSPVQTEKTVEHNTVFPRSLSVTGAPQMRFVVFHNQRLSFLSEADTQTAIETRIFSLFSLHGQYRRSPFKLVVHQDTKCNREEYRVQYLSGLQTVYDADSPSVIPFYAMDISVANATLVPPVYKAPRDRTMPLSAELLSWILSEHVEPSVLEKVSIANCKCIDANITTGLATVLSKSLYSVQIKLLLRMHPTAFYNIIKHHIHSLRYLYLLPFACEAENQEFLEQTRHLSESLVVNLDWKTERSAIFI